MGWFVNQLFRSKSRHNIINSSAFISCFISEVPSLCLCFKVAKNDNQLWVSESNRIKITLKVFCKKFKFIFGLTGRSIQRDKIACIVINFYFKVNIFLQDLHCIRSVRIWSYSDLHFLVFGLSTEGYSVSLRIQSECGKVPTRINPYTDTFTQCWISRTFKEREFLKQMQTLPSYIRWMVGPYFVITRKTKIIIIR